MDFIAGVMVGLLLPFIYGSILWWRESREANQSNKEGE